jgi:ABC-type phosphate transport system substrate-binding protein
MKKLILISSFLVLCSFKTNVTNLNYGSNVMTVQVITNSSNNIETLTKKQLNALLMGETTRWQNKQKVVLAIMKSNTPTGKLVAENILSISAKDIDKHYLTMVFQGKISAPKSFNSETELREFVSSTPGAIGVIGKSNVNESTKVIKIDGSENLAY